MSKQEWIHKLTSRKFWVAVAAFLGSIYSSITALNSPSEKVQVAGTVCGILGMAITAAVYSSSEAKVDAARLDQEYTNTNINKTE